MVRKEIMGLTQSQQNYSQRSDGEVATATVRQNAFCLPRCTQAVHCRIGSQVLDHQRILIADVARCLYSINSRCYKCCNGEAEKCSSAQELAEDECILKHASCEGD